MGMGSICARAQTRPIKKGRLGGNKVIREMNGMTSRRSAFSKWAVITISIWILGSYPFPSSSPAADFSEGYAAIKVGNKWGFTNQKGEYPIQPQFDEVGLFSEGLAAVRVGIKWGFVDGKGKWVIPPSFDGVMKRSGRERQALLTRP